MDSMTNNCGIKSGQLGLDLGHDSSDHSGLFGILLSLCYTNITAWGQQLIVGGKYACLYQRQHCKQ